MTITTDLSPERILLSHGLGRSSAGRQRLARGVRRRCDKYVPLDTGYLKGSAVISRDGRVITYPVSYAAAQFYGHYHHSDPLRGRLWHERMLEREREALLGEVWE